MTDPSDIPVTLTRLEGKIDTLAVKVDAGDRAAASLVEIVKTELKSVQDSVRRLEVTISGVQDATQQAISTVRVDLERQIRDLRIETDRAHESGALERGRLFGRMDKTDAKVNRLIGGCLFAGALIGVAAGIAQNF